MQLVYSSGGVDTPWQVVSANSDTMAAGMKCLSVVLRMNPADPATTSRLQCASGKQMLAWSAASRSLNPTRPLVAGELSLDRANGGRVLYVARPAELDTIGGHVLTVLPTTIETFDANGRVVSRLRERFAIELATATCGIFESVDGTGFRVDRTFALAAILNPDEIQPVPDATRPSARPPTPKC
jgi:hypothetical protein